MRKKKNQISDNNKLSGQLRNITLDKEVRSIPVLYLKRENCCGCSACYAVCSSNAIRMEPDEEGFLYPIVDADKCIGCNLCLSVCAFKLAQKEKQFIMG